MSLKTTFNKIKFRWKLATIFIILPLLLLVLVNSNNKISIFLKDYEIGNYLLYLYLLPLMLFERILTRMTCDGLSCIIFFGAMSIITIFLFYGLLGFLIGLLIENLRKKK